MKKRFFSKISNKLLIGFLCFSLIPLLSIGIWVSQNLHKELSASVYQNFLNVATIKKLMIQNYFEKEVKEINRVQEELDIVSFLNNIQNSSPTVSSYNTNEDYLKQRLIDRQQLYDYYDLLLVNKTGDVIFSAIEESDLGTNLLTGIYSESPLADAYRETLSTRKMVLSNIEPYAPSHCLAAFLTSPIFSETELIGVLVAQLSIQDLIEILSDRSGLVESARVLLVQAQEDEAQVIAHSHYTLDDIEWYNTAVPLTGDYPCPLALSGHPGSGVKLDRFNIEVVALWEPIVGLDMGIVVKAKHSEVFSGVTKFKSSLFLLLLIFIVLAIVIAIRISKTISDPLQKLLVNINNISDETHTNFSSDTYSGEIGELASAFEEMIDQIQFREIEQRHLSSSLLESKNKLSSIFNSSNVGIITLHKSGVPDLVNSKFCDILGYTIDDFHSSNLLDEITHPDDVDRGRFLFNQVVNGETNGYSNVKRYIHKNGSVIWVDLTASAIKNEHHELLYIIVTLNDVTEVQQSREYLVKSQYFSQLALQLSKSGSWYLDFINFPDRYFPSKELYKVLEVPVKFQKDSVLLKAWKKTFVKLHESYSFSPLDYIYLMMEGKEDTFDVIFLCLTPYTQKLLWLRTIATLVRDKNGIPSTICGVTQDVTDEQQRKVNLESLTNVLSLAQNISGVGYFEYFPSQSRYKVSTLYHKIYGTTPETHTTYEDFKALIHPDDLPSVVHSSTLIDDSESGYSQDFRIIVDGEIRFIRSMTIKQVSNDGEITYLGTVQDFTEQNMNEIELKSAVDRANDALSIAHAGTWSINHAEMPDLLLMDSRTKNILGFKHYNKDYLELGEFTANILSANEIVAEQFLQKILNYKEAINKEENSAIFQFSRIDNKQLIWLRILASFQYDEDGNLFYTKGIIQDVTEIKSAENEIARMNDVTNRALGVANAGTWYIDYSKDPDLIFLDAHSKILIGVDDNITRSFLTRPEYVSILREGDLTLANEYFKLSKDLLSDASRSEMIGVFQVSSAGKKKWIQSHTSIIRNASGQPIKGIGLIRDFTTLKTAQLEMQKQRDMNELLTNVSLQYLNVSIDDVNIALNQALKDVAEFVGLDRAYIFEIDVHPDRYSNTYEWCSRNTSPLIDVRKNEKILNKEMISAHQNNKYYVLYDINEISDPDVYDYYLKYNFINFITIPIFIDGKYFGFLGFDSISEKHRYADWEISVFYVFAEIIGSLKRRETNESELIEKTTRLNEAQHMAQIGNWRYDINNKISTWSDELFHIFGYTPNEVVPSFELAAKHLVSPLLYSFATEEEFVAYNNNHIYKIRNNLEEIRYIIIRAKISHEDRSDFVVGVVEDISEQHMAEQKVKLAKDKLDMALRAANMGTWEADLESNHFMCNTKGAEILGLAGGNIHDWLTKVYIEDRDKVFKLLRQVKSENLDSFQLTFRFHHKVNELVHIMVLCKLIRTDNDILLNASGIVWDVTAMKARENELVQSRKYISSVLDSISVGIAISSYDLQSYLMVNKTLKQMFGITDGSIKHFSFADSLVHSEDKILLDSTFSSAEKMSILELEMTKFDSGDTFWVQITITKSEFFGVESILICLYDITSIKKLQIGIETAKDTAIAANRGKSIFLANVSHEIRTPMNAILGFSELLDNRLSDPINRDFLSSIRGSSKSLLNLMNDILDFSKIEAGKFELSQERTNLRYTIRDVIKMFSITAERKHVTLHSDINSQLPSFVFVDELRLRQVLINLISNAVKFTSEGTIELEVQSICYDNTCDLTFKVKDTGLGVAKEDHDRIFKAFKQKEQQDNRKFGGTGLGLSICNSIVKLMGSQLFLDSELDEGSVFYFTLYNVPIDLSDVGDEKEYHTVEPDLYVSSFNINNIKADNKVVTLIKNRLKPLYNNYLSIPTNKSLEQLILEAKDISTDLNSEDFNILVGELLIAYKTIDIELIESLMNNFSLLFVQEK